MWHIEMMGSFRVLQNGRELALHNNKRASSLLAFVALMAGRPVSRDELTEAIWPNDDPTASRARLRTTLSSLRKLTGTGPDSERQLIRADRHSITLDPDHCSTDVSTYNSVLWQSGRAVNLDEVESLLRKARDLYTGHLLPQFDDPWIATERHSLLAKHSEVLHKLSRLCRQRGANDDAAEFTRQLIALDPLNEETHLTLMELYVSLEMPVMAINQYHQLEQVLSDHLQLRPSRKSREFYEQLRSGDTSLHQSARYLSRWQEMRNPKPIFGREVELKHLTELVAPVVENEAMSRLITVYGPGGVGKTHVAQVVASTIATEYMDNVWFVPLADIPRPHQIPGAIADAMLIERNVNIPLLSQISDQLCKSGGLLVLDNFEHLIEGGTEVVDHLLRTSTSLRILVTSRQSLSIKGEHLVELQPFHQPDLTHIEALHERVSAAAKLPDVSIFMLRARAVRPGLSLTGESVQAILDICSRLEGLPLSLEIAASRASVLSVQSLLSHIDDQLNLLVDHKSHSPLRHRSARNTIQWSYNLLDAELKTLLTNLSIFRGGWVADAACAICVSPPTSILRCLDLLDDLRTCSLINISEVHGHIRFTMLSVITAFASELLEKSDSAELVGDRHQQWYTRYVEEKSPESHVDCGAIFEEYPNIIRAIEHGIRPQSSEYQSMLALRICTAMKDFWLARGLAHEASLIVLQLAACDIPAMARAKAQTLAARLLLPRGHYSAADDLASEALSTANNRAVLHTAASARLVLARSACSRSEYDAAFEHAERACRDAELGNYPEVQAESHILMGMTYSYTASFEQARKQFEQALELYSRIRSRRGEALCNYRTSVILREIGNLAESENLINQSLHVYKDLGDVGGIAMCLHDLALIRLCVNDYNVAMERLQEALDLFKQMGNRANTASCLVYIAEVLRDTGNGTQGTVLLFDALKIYRELEDRRGEAAVLQSIARFYKDEGNISLAISTMHEALNIETTIGRFFGVAVCNSVIAELYKLLNDPLSARFHYQHAIKNLEAIDVTLAHIEIISAFVDLLIDTNELEPAAIAMAASTLIRDKFSNNLHLNIDGSDDARRKELIIGCIGENQFTCLWSKAVEMGIAGILTHLANAIEEPQCKANHKD